MPANMNDAVVQTDWDQDPLYLNECTPPKDSDLPFRLIPLSYCQVDLKSCLLRDGITSDAESEQCKVVPNTYKVMPSMKPSNLKNVPVHASQLKCNWCDFTCTDGYSFNTHVLKHVKSKPFYCLYCTFRASSLSRLSEHVTHHTSPGKVENTEDITESVDVTTSPSRKQKESMAQQKKPPESLECSLCGFKALKISLMIPHIKNHSLDSCDMSDSDDRPAKHSFDKPSAGKAISCTLCDFSSASLPVLLQHVLGHTKTKDQTDGDDLVVHDVGVDNTIFSCTECEYTCVRPNKLTEHMRVHGPGVVFYCPSCNYTSTTIGEMKVHRRNHGFDKPYACELCEARFTRLDNLKTHALVHSNERPFACPKCEYRGPSKARLKAHLKMHARDGKKGRTVTLTSVKCLQCSAQFSSVRSLKAHLRSHVYTYIADDSSADSDERRKRLDQLLKSHTLFKCPHCSFNTTRESILVTHIRAHTGERPFKCQTCQSTFTFKTHLVRHQRVHTGEKPFSCELCHARFSQSGNRKSHMEKVHGMKVDKRTPGHNSVKSTTIIDPLIPHDTDPLAPPDPLARPVISLAENQDDDSWNEQQGENCSEEAEEIEVEYQEMRLVKIEMENDDEMEEEDMLEEGEEDHYSNFECTVVQSSDNNNCT